MSAISYRPEIDGLRAVAVVPVILFHAGLSSFSGGFVGVDVFFVISGYLITSIIIRELTEGRFSIIRFWERRARRILPALYFVMTVTVPLAWMLMLPDEYRAFARSLLAVSVFGSNVLFWRESGYFAAAAEEKPFLHSWSLAVEEQFYIFFPLAMLLVWRFGWRPLFTAIALVLLASLGLSHVAAAKSPVANFYLLPTRAWELMAGTLCALWLSRRPVRGSDLLAGLGLGLILGSVVLFDETTPFPSLYALAPVGGTALIVLFARPGGRVTRMLIRRPVVAVGLISYSAYLWHQPLFAFARVALPGAPPAWLMLALAALSLGLAALSWRFVELPFRNRQGAFRGARLPKALVPGVALIAIIGLHGELTEGRRAAWIASASPEKAQTYQLVELARHSEPEMEEGQCVFTVTRFSAEELDRIRICSAILGAGLAIIGDSHSRELFQILGAADAAEFMVAFSAGRCRPYSKSLCPYADFKALVKAEPALFSTVIYNQQGWQFFYDDFGRNGRRVFTVDHSYDAIDRTTLHIREDLIADVVRYLADLPENLDVIWVMPKLEPMIDTKTVLRLGCGFNFALRPGLEGLYRFLEAAIAAESARYRIRSFSTMNALEFDVSLDFMSCQAFYWRDWDHFSETGKDHFRPRLVPRLMDFIAEGGAPATLPR